QWAPQSRIDANQRPPAASGEKGSSVKIVTASAQTPTTAAQAPAGERQWVQQAQFTLPTYDTGLTSTPTNSSTTTIKIPASNEVSPPAQSSVTHPTLPVDAPTNHSAITPQS